jgi:hypothetical protein
LSIWHETESARLVVVRRLHGRKGGVSNHTTRPAPLRRHAVVRRHRTSWRHTTSQAGSEHVLHRQSMIHNDVFEHVHVERNVKGSSSHRCHLTQKDVLGHTTTIVDISNSGGFEQNLDSLFK